MNGIRTVWSLSIRFWVGVRGSRMTNPVVLCLNLVTCRAATKQDAAVKYKFGILNQNTQELEMGGQDKIRIA
jgi:speckle-type POZ protein